MNSVAKQRHLKDNAIVMLQSGSDMWKRPRKINNKKKKKTKETNKNLKFSPCTKTRKRIQDGKFFLSEIIYYNQ